MIPIKRDGYLTTIETSKLRAIVKRSIRYLMSLEDEYSGDYSEEIKEYKLLLDSLRDID